MTKSADVIPPVVAAAREPRPLQWLEPVRVPVEQPVLEEAGVEFLALKTIDSIPALASALVDHTIALQNRRALESGDRRPIQLSVLNRRRRASRAWILAILGGKIDAATQHAVCHQWILTLAGSGPDPRTAARVGASCVEFLRGAITALIFDEPAPNLLGHARALHALEQVLGVHLAAIRASGRPRASTR
jgi:hypothetical protein